MKKRILVLSLCMAAVFGGCGTQKESVSDQADFAQPEAAQTETMQAEAAQTKAAQTEIIQAEAAQTEAALPEAIQTETEGQESFDMESYKDLIRDFEKQVDDTVVYYAHMGWYELDYWQLEYAIFDKTEIPDVEKFVELAYDYAEEKTGITKEKLEQMYGEVCAAYEEIVQMEVLGEEAEEIKSEAIEFFLLYDKLRDAIVNPVKDFEELYKYSGNCLREYKAQLKTLETYLY